MLRPIKMKDVDGMLEWIKDPEINCFFQFDAKSRNRETTLEYIQTMYLDENTKHFAVVDEQDEYLGTISLKNINYRDETAEYAISLRKKVIGSGVAREATLELLEIAFHKLHLNKIYLNVYQDNIRAIKFYEKMGFIYEGTFKRHIKVRGEHKNLSWYALFKEAFNGKSTND